VSVSPRCVLRSAVHGFSPSGNQPRSEPIVLRSRGLPYLKWAAAVVVTVVYGALIVDGPGPDPVTADYIGTAVLARLMALGSFAHPPSLELSDSGVPSFGCSRQNVWRSRTSATSRSTTTASFTRIGAGS
jgi:hypothetical protein